MFGGRLHWLSGAFSRPPWSEELSAHLRRPALCCGSLLGRQGGGVDEALCGLRSGDPSPLAAMRRARYRITQSVSTRPA
jgi:hypothetical protein